MKEKKPSLSDSALNMLYKCGQQYYYRYVEGKKIPPGIAAVIGRATHKSVYLDLQNKIDKGVLRDISDVEDAARDGINGEWQRGVRLVEEELKESAKKLKGAAVDQSVALSVLHHDELAPIIEPVQVERFFRL